MKRFLFQIWRILPSWLLRPASAIIRPHYQVVVGAIIFNEQDQILLCKHTYRRMHPWGLPGGDMKFGEDPTDAVRRELWEETGLSAQTTRLVLVESSKKIRKVVLTYLCTGTSGTYLPNEEVSMIQYFDIGALPVLYREEHATIEKVLAILRTGVS